MKNTERLIARGFLGSTVLQQVFSSEYQVDEARQIRVTLFFARLPSAEAALAALARLEGEARTSGASISHDPLRGEPDLRIEDPYLGARLFVRKKAFLAGVHVPPGLSPSRPMNELLEALLDALR